MYIKMNIYMLLISKLKEKGHRTPRFFRQYQKDGHRWNWKNKEKNSHFYSFLENFQQLLIQRIGKKELVREFFPPTLLNSLFLEQLVS